MLLTRYMPIYEYSCSKCGEVIERIQKFSDPPLRKHAGCGGTLTKLISQSAFQLKGTGWYVTDYARAEHKGKASADKDGGESESKPAAGQDKGKAAESKVKNEKKAEPSGKPKPSAQ
jgi:putative FmdB family regulatory protein